MTKKCSWCKRRARLSYHSYCYICLRKSRGQDLTPKFRRDSNNKTKCSKCGSSQRAPSHNYCRECRNASVRVWAKQHGGSWANMTPEQRKRALARKMVYNWVHRGKMERQPCEICGSKLSSAHHDDYSKPLQVRWLCQKHHDLEDEKSSIDTKKPMG